jgi:SpoVK/Ycf46/Vps4 family AAA+-type ATPase
MGEGEKLIKGLFDLARKKQPTVLFFDEIDSLMGSRKDGEHEASRRIKTEFMVQVDGAATTASDRILVIGATNTPWDLDEAVLRRMSKRIYIPLPDALARRSLINNLMEKNAGASSKSTLFSVVSNVFRGNEPTPLTGTWGNLSEEQCLKVIEHTEGYSGSDITALCKEAAMGPIREISPEALRTGKSLFILNYYIYLYSVLFFIILLL